MRAAAADARARELAGATGGEVHALTADTREGRVGRCVGRGRRGGAGRPRYRCERRRPPRIAAGPTGIAGVGSAYVLDEVNTKLVGYPRVARAAASPRSVAINGDAIAADGGSPRAIHY